MASQAPKSKKVKQPDEVEMLRSDLIAQSGQWRRLSKLSGIPHRWLVAFAGSEIKTPSFDRVKLLGKYLGWKISLVQGPHFNKFNPDA